MATVAPVKISHMVFVGEDRTLTFTLRDQNTGVIQNITGWTLQWKLEPAQGQAASVTKSGTVTDGPNGVCTVALAAADTAGLSGGNYFHHLDRTDSGFAGVWSAGPFALQAR